MTDTEAPEGDVVRVRDIDVSALTALLAGAGLDVVRVSLNESIPGSHWGDDEAGLIRHTLHVRDDTPVHSALHEACHWLLMSDERRLALHTDAGGTAAEEDAVCFLQICLADLVDGIDRRRMLDDMDRWGYSFRLGSAERWFTGDAEDAALTLKAHERKLNDAFGALDYRAIVPIG